MWTKLQRQNRIITCVKDKFAAAKWNWIFNRRSHTINPYSVFSHKFPCFRIRPFEKLWMNCNHWATQLSEVNDSQRNSCDNKWLVTHWMITHTFHVTRTDFRAAEPLRASTHHQCRPLGPPTRTHTFNIMLMYTKSVVSAKVVLPSSWPPHSLSQKIKHLHPYWHLHSARVREGSTDFSHRGPHEHWMWPEDWISNLYDIQP